jgi:hypothetical protein
MCGKRRSPPYCSPKLDFSPRIWKGGALQAAEKRTTAYNKGITTAALGAPPLLIQEGSWPKNSPPQMRRGGAPSAGVVLKSG